MEISIKTFEDACKALGLNPTECIPVVTAMPEKYQAAAVAHACLMIIAEAINQEVSPGWNPDWQDDDQWKYYPWFEMGNSASGFSFDDAFYGGSGSYVGSRLCYCSREAARYAGQQFIELYKQLMVL